MADEPRRSVRATKGQHTKSQDALDQTTEPSKKRGGKKAAAKKAASQDEEEEESEIIRCICGVTEQDDDEDEDWIACENCDAWQHNVCMGVTTDAAALEKMKYYCEICKPEDHKELLDGIARGEKPWEDRRKAHEQAELEAQKAKKGKKGKGKKVADVKPDAGQNGKAVTPDAPDSGKKDSVNRSATTKRKAKEELPEEVSKAKVRKTSPAKADPELENAPPDIPATINELEKTRAAVANFIRKNLHLAMKAAQKNGTYKAAGAELDKRATRLALEIERATHDSSVTSKAYGDQSRKLGSNLKTNQDLCDRLLSGSLKPSAFAIMTSDEMASKELQRQTAEMIARAEKQSIMVTEDGPRVRRTHKGDEVVEQDSFVDPTDEAPRVRRRSMLDPNADMVGRSRENSPGEGTELPMDIDDYRSRDDIRGNAAPSHPLSVDTQSSPPAVRKASTQVGSFDINNVFSKVQSPTIPQHVRKPSGPVLPKDGPGEDADIDRLLEDGNESPPYSPTDFDADPDVVWRGSLVMNSVADFPAVAKHVGGADLSKLPIDPLPWSDLLAERLSVAGRIDPEKATEYLCGLRYSSPTDVVVLAVTPTGEAATQQFKRLFEYFHSKNRYGVVGNKGYANVRDTYLVPVPAGTGNVPEFIMNLDANKLPENRPEPVILITLVIRHALSSDLSRSYDGSNSPMMAHPQRQMSMGSQSGPAMSPIAPQGPFQSPQIPPAITSQQDAQRRQRIEDQRRGEEVAASILGPLISAPTVSFLIPQAWQMQPNEWNVIKEIFQQNPKSQDDLTYLSQLLEQRNAPPK